MFGRVWCVCWGMGGVCVGACVGFGACVVCVEACVLGHGGCGGVCGIVCGACVGCWCCGRKSVSFAPLYYPDTLVNPDTCLGEWTKVK